MVLLKTVSHMTTATKLGACATTAILQKLKPISQSTQNRDSVTNKGQTNFLKQTVLSIHKVQYTMTLQTYFTITQYT